MLKNGKIHIKNLGFLAIILIILYAYLFFIIYNLKKKCKLTNNLKNDYRIISSKIWINKNSNIIFPELSGDIELDRKYSPEGVSLAFEAGGRRSYSGFIGFIRGLYKININNSNAFESSQFVSTVSGSSWLLGTYLFANKNIDSSILLGQYIPPEDIDMNSLTTINFESKNNYYLGNTLINADVKKYVQHGYNIGIRTEYLWNYAIGNVFLKPYGLNDKIVALNEKQANITYSLTGIKPIIPHKNSPFWISNCALLNVKNKKIRGTTIFQVTPIYSGIPNIICNKVNPFGFDDTKDDCCVGGVLQSTYSIGSMNPNLNYKESNKSITVDLKIPSYQKNLFTLESIIGTSGSSQATKFSYISDNKDLSPSLMFSSVIPSFDLWSPTSDSTTYLPIGDGAHCDWTGITSLLSRNVKHIISIISCGNEIKDSATPESYGDFCGLNILNLFGLNDDNLCEKEKPYLYESNNNQVFQKNDWKKFAQQILDTKSTGGPVFTRNKLLVLPNYSLGIKGKYYVDLLVIIIQPSFIYNNLLPKSITNTFSDLSGPFPNFPNYSMTNKDFDLLISLEKHQINLLDSYVEWCVLYPTLKNTILNMFHSVFSFVNSGVYP